ncbi:MAG: FHA domain-containing protein [Planctomycetes bacterium]|nr:FHA domain-containing protein [Planctomycetota bacterium]
MSTTARIVVAQGGTTVCRSDAEVVIGGRTGCDVVVDDPLLADRHCRIAWDGTFTVRDLGSATGTWVDGKRVGAATDLGDGSEIVLGTTRLAVRITGAGPSMALALDVQPNAFWWQKPGKGVFDNDPDAMVRAEVGFGRFPALHLLNRLAAVAAVVLLLAALFVGAVFDPLADAGPLLPAHAHVQANAAASADPHAPARIAAEQGCRACHEPGHGPTATRCLQCHGDLRAEPTRRHPWTGDGELGALPGLAVDEGLCVRCHRDHAGRDFLHPEAQALVGDCAACHATPGEPFDLAALRAKARAAAPAAPPRQQPFASWTFPHEAHLAKGMPCAVCHAVDGAVAAARERGVADDPDRRDFAPVPFATCAACHVPDGTPLAQVAADDAARWRAKDHQWPVAWHGTEEGGRGCRQCHAEERRDGATVFGPELRPVERPAATVEQYVAERARYLAGARRHTAEFAAHAGARGCGECHLTGQVQTQAARPARPFWHALHLAPTALQPATGTAGAVSQDPRGGCASCHGDLGESTALRPAAQGAFTWREDAGADPACRVCHADGDAGVTLQPVPVAVAPDGRRAVADFPHGVHVRSQAYGRPGSTLADGCFSCHTFVAPATGDDLQRVPVVKSGVADCRGCHQGHANVGGGACQQCHPAIDGRSSSFLEHARVPAGTLVGGRAAPARPMRAWPAANGFSHLSPGHTGSGLDGKPLDCASCHDVALTAAAKSLDAVPIPDGSQAVCRDCHLERQFHWR